MMDNDSDVCHTFDTRAKKISLGEMIYKHKSNMPLLLVDLNKLNEHVVAYRCTYLFDS